MSSIPFTQRAVVYSVYGEAAAVLRFETARPVRTPRGSEVLIRVHAASINPVDRKLSLGYLSRLVGLSFPFVPLRDCSGVVVATGPQVRRLKVGDAVHCDSDLAVSGGAQEYNVVPESRVSTKPESLSFAQAAALPLAAQTSYGALKAAGVTSGSRVVVVGASGGTGVFGVQIAKALGAAHVIGVCSGRNTDFVRGLGADAVVDYTTGPLSAAIRGNDVDVVYDCVGGKEQWIEAQKVLKHGGRFVTVAGDTGMSGPVTISGMLSMLCTLAYRNAASWFGAQHGYSLRMLRPNHSDLDAVDELVRAGRIAHIPIERTFDFSAASAVAMFVAIGGNRTRGKLVMEIVKQQ